MCSLYCDRDQMEELVRHECRLVIYGERNHGDELWPKLLS